MPTPIADGRTRRRTRTHDAILDALLALVREGDPRPTARAIATRAGVQTRTLFRHFPDVASLHAEAAARVRSTVQPHFATPPPAGALATRVRWLVRTRAAAFEEAAPFKQAANRLSGRHEFVRAYQSGTARDLRRHLLFALPELRRAPTAVAAAFELVTSLEAWERLRSHQALPPARARAAMEAAALALVPALRGTR